MIGPCLSWEPMKASTSTGYLFVVGPSNARKKSYRPHIGRRLAKSVCAKAPGFLFSEAFMGFPFALNSNLYTYPVSSILYLPLK